MTAHFIIISPETLQSNIKNNTGMLIIDIQVEDEFARHHIKNSQPTYAYPVKSDSDTGKHDVALQKHKETDAPLVIVCPRGAGGAKRSYDYLKEKGIAEDRLLILEKGMAGWPYPETTVANENYLPDILSAVFNPKSGTDFFSIPNIPTFTASGKLQRPTSSPDR